MLEQREAEEFQSRGVTCTPINKVTRVHNSTGTRPFRTYDIHYVSFIEYAYIFCSCILKSPNPCLNFTNSACLVFFLHQYDMVQQKTKTKSYQVLAVAGADLQGSVLPWKIQTYLQ